MLLLPEYRLPHCMLLFKSDNGWNISQDNQLMTVRKVILTLAIRLSRGGRV